MLRKLGEKDVDLMLEWMHDSNVNKNFSVDFDKFDYSDAIEFVENSFTSENQHFAVVDEQDVYQGTISLKNISYKDSNAEYAVVFRTTAQGTGFAKEATKEIIKYAFEELKLNKVYLNVLKENVRARKFYEKMGFKQEGIFLKHKFLDNKFHDLYWYAVYKN